MNILAPDRLRRHAVLTAALVALGATAAQAAPFLYNPGELVLTLRQSGNAEDLAQPGYRRELLDARSGNHRPDQQPHHRPAERDVPEPEQPRDVVSGANRPPLVEAFPIQTLWVTAPRLAPDEPAAIWLRKGQSVQGNAGSQIDAIGKTAVSFSSLTPAGPANTVTAVAIPLTSPFTLGPILGASSDFVGSFQGSVAQLTTRRL